MGGPAGGQSSVPWVLTVVGAAAVPAAARLDPFAFFAVTVQKPTVVPDMYAGIVTTPPALVDAGNHGGSRLSPGYAKICDLRVEAIEADEAAQVA